MRSCSGCLVVIMFAGSILVAAGALTFDGMSVLQVTFMWVMFAVMALLTWGAVEWRRR